jgi:hypothetical protein
VLKVNKECRDLATLPRQQLSFDAAVCFMREHRMQLPACAERLAPGGLLSCISEISQHEQSRNVYIEFYSNIHRWGAGGGGGGLGGALAGPGGVAGCQPH